MALNLHIGTVLLSVVLLSISVYAYRSTTPPVRGRLRVVLVSLRGAGFLVLAFLLADPRLLHRSTRREPAEVVALIDRSASMSLPATGWRADAGPDRFAVAQGVSERLSRAVRGRGGMFRAVYFAGQVSAEGDSVPVDGQGTDVTGALASVYKRHAASNLAALVVISDGVETEARVGRPDVPPVPVFTVGIGDTTRPEDVRITDVEYNSIVRAPSRSPVRAVVEYSGDTSKRIHLRLTESGRVIFAKDTVLTRVDREIAEEIMVEFRDPGRRRFVLEVVVDGYDAEPENNRRDIVVEVEKAGVRVLIVDMVPQWEMHFLTEFLKNEQTFDFDLVADFGAGIASRDPKIKSSGGFLADLDDYDTLILASISAGFIDDRAARAIDRFVRERGHGLLILPGPSSLFEHAGAWNRLRALLPVGGTPPHRFNLQFTSVRPGAQAATNPITSQLVPLLSQADWQQRTPLLGYYGPLVPKNGVEVLLETGRRGAPAFIYHTVGKGRVAILSAGPLWRWKFLDEKNTLYDEMVSRILDVLSRGENTERFLLLSRKNVYDSGESPVFTAEIFNEKMQPVTGVPVRLELARLDKDSREVPLDIVTMSRQGADNPRFKATIPSLAPGRYRVRGQVELSGRTINSEAMDFSVSSVSVEFQRVAQDRENLVSIARQSGGTFVPPDDVEALISRFSLEARDVSSLSELSFRTSAAVFAILLSLLSIEWVIRKRAGMI